MKIENIEKIAVFAMALTSLHKSRLALAEHDKGITVKFGPAEFTVQPAQPAYAQVRSALIDYLACSIDDGEKALQKLSTE